MTVTRRDVVLASLGAAAIASASIGPSLAFASNERQAMYGLIGKMITAPGQREALAAILLESVGDLPGCLSYIVAADTTDANALWITEVWDSKAHHDASLQLPAVKEAIGKGRPLIAGFGERFATTPLGGQGIGG